MCHFRSRLWGFLEEISWHVWHLGCVNESAAGVGRPVRTAQTRQTGQEPYRELILPKGRLLSTNIGKLNSAEPADPCRCTESQGKTVISQDGDFFAVPFAAVALAHPRRVSGGAL